MKIVAMVRMNRRWAYVFDKPANLIYREEFIDGARYLIGRDGPLVDFLGYEKSRHSRAFAGRELALQMEDGSVRKVRNDWWSCSSPLPGTVHLSYSDVDSLRSCYVFYGGNCNQSALEDMVQEYEERKGKPPWRFPDGGYRYPYREFEKAIKYDAETRRLRSRIFKLERDKKNLIAEARRQAAQAG